MKIYLKLHDLGVDGILFHVFSTWNKSEPDHFNANEDVFGDL